MPRVVSTREGGAQNFDTTYPDTVREIHIDGVAEVIMTANSAKLALFQIRPRLKDGRDDSPLLEAEQREVVALLSMPLPVLVEAFTNVLRGVSVNAEAVKTNISQVNERFFTVLDRMARNVPQPAAPVEPSPRPPATKKAATKRKVQRRP